MKRFDYNSMKLNMPKTPEELAREKAQQEKDKAQSQVDSVLYQDTNRPRNNSGSSSNGSSDQPKKKNQLDTHDFVRNGSDVDSKVKVTPPSEQDVKTEVVKSRVSTTPKHYEDDDVEDFKDHFGESGYENLEEVIPEKFVSTNVEQQEYDEDAIMDAAMELYDNVGEEETDDEPKQVSQPVVSPKASQSVKKSTAKSVQPVHRPMGKSEEEFPISHIKKFPRDLAQRIKTLFPAARTIDEALAAYVYLKEGKPAEIPMTERLFEVMDSYSGEVITVKDAQDELVKEILQLKVHDRLLAQKLETIELAVAYSLFDRIGFRKNDQNSPGTIDFLEQGVGDMITRLEQQSKLNQMRNNAKNGRPIR